MQTMQDYIHDFKKILSNYLDKPNTDTNRKMLSFEIKQMFNKMAADLRWIKTDSIFIDLLDTDIQFDIIEEDNKMVIQPLNIATSKIFKLFI
ncbi:MAG: hypothetical protein [Wendovervirus sonii]|uniref:Uncharacterized protein n=1 Tax=phage Lak_Megaphage_Sonny TaxID=3109229 RepID=A0ABZ0Z3Z3_9CAUD|nr:MAG: hypothetical protein [phage Lak_Megaphage_Sonny]